MNNNTVHDNYFRVSVFNDDMKSDGSIYFRIRDGQRQIVAGSKIVAQGLTEYFGEPDGRDEKDLPLWNMGA